MRRSSYGRGVRFVSESSSSSGGAAIPPPPSCQTNSRGAYSTLSELAKPHPSKLSSKSNSNSTSKVDFNKIVAASSKITRRPLTGDEYFEDEEDPSDTPAYLPAPGSPGPIGSRNDDDDEDDPLDAFMASIEKEVKKEASGPKNEKKKEGVRQDIEELDDEETYYKYVAENPNFGKDDDSENDDVEYDEDGNPIAPKKSKWIDPLPPIDHSTIQYESFEKNFYEEHSDISQLTDERVNELRNTLKIKVSGAGVPKPVSSFAHLGFPEELLKSIRKSEFSTLTPIQAQGIPIALNGRDLIGIAKTGSGKTAAFLWPLLIHIADQRELSKGQGPIGLILCPTRELALQIYSEARKFGKVFGIRVCCCYGGGSKYEQSKDLEEGAEIVVATPGRMIDMIKIGATNLARVTFLVLDEADRMFEMGFEAQVRSICDHVRPERQTLLFSATFRKKIEKLARVALADPIRVIQGDIGEANSDIKQIVLVHPLGGSKWNWLTKNLVQMMSEGSVLIFVTKKANAEELHANLKVREFDALLLHGDMDQIERNKVISSFRKKEAPILVATDVAARGLDIPHIRTVVNFDVARDIDTHTHRVGRTGRAGEKGTAYTCVTEKDKEFAGHLVRNLETAGQEVNKDLLDLAMKSSWFKKARFKEGKGKSASKITCRGLGFREETASTSASVSEFLNPKIIAPPPLPPSLNATPGGPGSGRLQALKAAFKSQYSTQFKLGADSTVAPSEAFVQAPLNEEAAHKFNSAADAPKRKKSRWN